MLGKLVILFLLTGSEAVQRFLSEPESVVVREGAEEVILSCVVSGKLGSLQWTRDDFGLGTSRRLSGFSRYSMTGREKDGEWHLRITNVTMEDDARFQCQVGATETVDPIRSEYAEVTVVSVPEPPVITAGPSLVLREGRPGLVECVSRGGRPASSITWRLNGEILTSEIDEKIEHIEGSKKTVTVSQLSLPSSRSMSGGVLECEAVSEDEELVRRVMGEGEELMTRVNTSLVVEYQPEVSIAANMETVQEGDLVKMTCSASASPELVEYQWHVGGQEVTEARGASELVLQADRRLHGQRVTCLARNRVGQSSADLELDVKCKF